MSAQDAQVGVETTETVETLTAKLEAESQARAKAEAKIVDMKKSTTPAKEVVKEETPTTFDEATFEKKYEEKKFFESNPDMLEYKDKFADYTAKGIGYKEAKILVENSDETIANRKKASQTNFTNWDTPVSMDSYSMEDIAKMSPEERINVYKMRDAWKIQVK